ncbi:MAG: hypothetical protein MOB07_29455 [Acidobacteria bacterium]|nr:hypothetical protein [Acidobacteriota bacterium]
MSEEEFIRRYDAAKARRDISTEEGLKAAGIIFKQADKEGIECALAGGIAMHIYGYLRATHDVDMLASKVLDLPGEEKISFGGKRYVVEVGERKITVDVIVRDDFFRDFYEAALSDAHTTPDGWRVITAEWMVILKYLAGRGKDQLDLLWMLKEPNLVDRGKIAKLLERVMGKTGAQAVLRGLENFYVQAEVMRAGDENGERE